MPIIKPSINNPNTAFNLNGLEYEKGIYTVYYDSVEISNSGVIDESKIRVGLRAIADNTDLILVPKLVKDFSDGTIDYTDFNTLVSDLLLLVSSPVEGVSGAIISQQANNFSSLEDGTEEGQISYVENSQGTKWNPLSTYKPAGWYVWSGTTWVSDRNAIATQLESNILSISDIQNRVITNEVKVRSASDLVNIDSSKVYLIDGFIDLGTQQIEVPSGGFFYRGLDYFVSGLYSSQDNYNMFVNKAGENAGNIRGINVEHHLTGSNSNIFNLDNQSNFGAIEFQDCNFGTFAPSSTFLGNLTSFRQFRVSGCAFINISGGLTFNGTWAGGFAINDTIVLNPTLGLQLFKEGTNLIFNGTSITNINAQAIDSTGYAFGFTEDNFLLDESFITDPTTRFNIEGDPIPLADKSSTKFFFRGRGIKNTFSGGRWEITSQVITPLTVGLPAKALGTTTYEDMVHYSGLNNNEFVYESSIQKDYIVTGQLVVDGGANDEIDIIIRKWNELQQSYEDIRTFTRNISNVLGGLDIAYFDPYAPITLNKGDRIEVWLRNNTDNTDATLLSGSFIAINVRN